MSKSTNRDKINTGFGYSSSFKGYPKTGISRLRGNDLVQIGVRALYQHRYNAACFAQACQLYMVRILSRLMCRLES